MFLLRHIVSSFPITSVYFSGPAGGCSLRARVTYMIRKAFLPSRVIPSPGHLGKFVAKIVLNTWASETAKWSKSVNSFGPTVFFPRVIRSSLSIRVAESKNEFAAVEIRSNMGVGHVTNKIRKKKSTF